MAIALLPNQRWDFVMPSEANLPRDQQTVFHLRSLTKREKHHYQNLRTRQLGFIGNEGECRFQIVRAGLVGWSNFKTADGREVKFVTEKEDVEVLGRKCRPISEECMDHITDQLEVDLTEEILIGSNLNHEDRKNSPSPQA